MLEPQTSDDGMGRRVRYRWVSIGIGGTLGLTASIICLEQVSARAVLMAGVVFTVIGSIAVLVGRKKETIARIATVTWPTAALGIAGFGLLLSVCALAFTVFGPLDGDSKASRTKSDAMTLSSAVQMFKDSTGAYPTCLQQLAHPPDGGKPYLDREEFLLDAWGRQFDYDPQGPRNEGKQPDIWTVTPQGELIGNWMLKK